MRRRLNRVARRRTRSTPAAECWLLGRDLNIEVLPALRSGPKSLNLKFYGNCSPRDASA